MKKVKNEIAKNLFKALCEANNADCYEGEGVNDLEPPNANYTDLYGSIANSICFLGFEDEYETWVNTGDMPEFTE